MKLNRAQLRVMITEALEKPTHDPTVIQKLNSLIAAAKQKDDAFRKTRDDIFHQPPKDDWAQIDMLIDSLGMNINPPKELSVHKVVDGQEGEILASYLTYDEAVAYGRGLAMVPVDGFNGRIVSEPVPAESGNLYYVYQDQY